MKCTTVRMRETVELLLGMRYAWTFLVRMDVNIT
jgi:hypothetical protein